jgi:hypothetical protein
VGRRTIGTYQPRGVHRVQSADLLWPIIRIELGEDYELESLHIPLRGEGGMKGKCRK